MKRPNRSSLAIAATLALMASTAAWADDAAPAAAAPAADAKPKGPTLADILGNSSIDVKGYLDASYIGHNRTPDSGVQVFDTDKNEFALHQAGITVSSTPKEGVGGLINLTVGRDAGIFCSYGACSSSGSTAGSGGNFDVTQAYIQYATGAWTVIGGKFTTLAGAEVIDSSADTNVTRSILFGKVPFTHTGIRATRAMSDTTSIILGINNGWDQVTDMNSSKTAEVGLTTAFTKDTSLAASVYSGAESMSTMSSSLTPTAGGRSGTRTLFDLVFTSNLTDTTTFILNGDYASQDNVYGVSGAAKYWGLAAYLNHQFNDKYRVSIRAERFVDESGAAVAVAGTPPGANTVKELTLTVGYAPTKNFELRGEARVDNADKGIFAASDGTPNQTLGTLAIQGIYKF
jgi:hypothetical protein